MSTSAPGLSRPRQRLAAPETALLLLLAAGAWTATLSIMSGMTGAMGLDLLLFIPVWTMMMAAMMLPSVAPTASLYARAAGGRRWVRFPGLVLGYLTVWAAAGLPAYGLARLGGWLASHEPGVAHGLAIAIFAGCGVYQLSGLKDRCLTRCRSPLSLLLHYGSYQGRFRSLRVGAHHGAYCLGCCWALMSILIAVGVMNVAVMVGIAALVLVEKVWVRGPVAGRLAGIAALGLAIAVIWVPGLAPGLHASPMATMGS